MTDFQQTLYGKLFKFFGSISVTSTILFRALSFRTDSILSYIYNIESFRVILAIIGSIYSIYLLIYCICALKNSFVYLFKCHWIKRKNLTINYIGCTRRILVSILFIVITLIKIFTAVAFFCLNFDQLQELLGLAANNKWRIKTQARNLGNYLNISDIDSEDKKI